MSKPRDKRPPVEVEHRRADERWKAVQERAGLIDATTPRSVWEEYERRKRVIAETARDSAEYDRRILELIDELGI